MISTDVIAPAQGHRSFIIKTLEGTALRKITCFLWPNAYPKKPPTLTVHIQLLSAKLILMQNPVIVRLLNKLDKLYL